MTFIRNVGSYKLYKGLFKTCIYIRSFVGIELYRVVLFYITGLFYIRVCAQLLKKIQNNNQETHKKGKKSRNKSWILTRT